MRCNCENSHCAACGGHGCVFEASNFHRVLYVGPVCEPCFDRMPAEYRVNPYYTQTRAVSLENEVLWRGDYVMLEATRAYELLGPFDEEGIRDSMCNPVYLFHVYAYNELTQNYEIPVADQLSEYDNFEFNRLLHEWECDAAASAAEDRYYRE